MSRPSLADALRAASDSALAALLTARRDLATPPPSDSAVLATRAGTPGSVARVCEELDTVALAVLEALLLADADVDPVDLATVERTVGVECRAAVDLVRRLALVWGGDDALSVVAAARDVLGPFPAGLAATDSALDDVDVPAVVAEVSEPERAALRTLAAGPPIGTTKDAASDVGLDDATTPVQRLLARGLLIRRDPETVELPRQVALHLRGDRVFADGSLTEPQPPVRTHPHGQVAATGAGAATELLRLVDAVLELWSQAPPPVLKAGGLGVRELRRVTRALDIDEQQAVLIAELLVGARLVADSKQVEAEWVPTTLADSWWASTPSGRWSLLAAAWLGLPRLPGLATTADAGDSERPPNPLSDRLHHPRAPALRRQVLAVLAELPADTGIADPADVVTLLAWRAPRGAGRRAADAVRWTLSEATTLGVIGLGALTEAGHVLLAAPQAGEPDDEHRRRAAAVMAEAMPKPVDHVLLQADLTVVAPGPLTPELATDIAAVADVESGGHATVYRVTEDSVRRALDSGRTADELHQLFATSSATPVPQALTYLVDDVARRHGRLRGGACASFLRCDDPVLLDQVTGDPSAAPYELRRIAPTVAVSPLPLAEVIDGLRAIGYAPAAEGPDGRVVDLRPSGRRVSPPSADRKPGVSGPPTAEHIEAAVTRIRAGDRAATARRGNGVRNADTSQTLALLSAAARQRRAVWIDVVDANGTATQRVVQPVRVGSGAVEGADAERYPLHRITSAAYVED